MKLKQCLLNLLRDACKFTEKGEIKLRVIALPGNLLRFEVTDTGIGMTPEQQIKVFAPFARPTPPLPENSAGPVSD